MDLTRELLPELVNMIETYVMRTTYLSYDELIDIVKEFPTKEVIFYGTDGPDGIPEVLDRVQSYVIPSNFSIGLVDFDERYCYIPKDLENYVDELQKARTLKSGDYIYIDDKFHDKKWNDPVAEKIVEGYILFGSKFMGTKEDTYFIKY